jgi:hypothetical protein
VTRSPATVGAALVAALSDTAGGGGAASAAGGAGAIGVIMAVCGTVCGIAGGAAVAADDGGDDGAAGCAGAGLEAVVAGAASKAGFFPDGASVRVVWAGDRGVAGWVRPELRCGVDGALRAGAFVPPRSGNACNACRSSVTCANACGTTVGSGASVDRASVNRTALRIEGRIYEGRSGTRALVQCHPGRLTIWPGRAGNCPYCGIGAFDESSWSGLHRGRSSGARP